MTFLIKYLNYKDQSNNELRQDSNKKKYDLTGFFKFVFQIQVLLPCNGCPVLDPPNFGQVRVSPSSSSAFVGKNNMQLERQTMFLSII